MLQIKYCDKCSLAIFNKFVPVSGEMIGTDILIIGESPGSTEARKGKPFVSKSGKLLKKVLRRYNLIDRCYFTNVVKCRPPANRSPRQKEYIACRPYLLNEIKELQPKVIILLGLTAINSILPSENYVKNKAYKFNKVGKVVLGYSYHPNYILKNKKDEPKFYNFFNNVAAIYQHLNPYYTKPL